MNNPTTYEELVAGCEDEKLHLSGKIQSFGAIIVVNFISQHITHASSNLKEFTNKEPDSAIGSLIYNIMPEISSMLYSKPSKVGLVSFCANFYHINNTPIDLIIHFNGADFILEFEPNFQTQRVLGVHTAQLQLLTPPNTAKEFETYKQTFVDEVRNLIDFDRVMLYKFHPDWSGEVVNESIKDNIGSYLGLRFPASDIPQIARNIYLLNQFRFIPDTNANSCDLLSLDKSVPDLTYSDLRSVSLAHLEYLSNMGVAASFSIAIKIGGVLWGLLACHNLTPKYLSLDVRNIAAILAKSYSIGSMSYQTNAKFKLLDEIDKKINNILELILSGNRVLDSVQENSQAIIELVNSCGIAVAISDDVIMIGNTPPVCVFAALDGMFIEQDMDSIYASQNFYEDILLNDCAQDSVCGALAIKAKTYKSELVRFYWFKLEEIKEVTWAGNPNKPLAENSNAKALSPRRSFEHWGEIQKNRSSEWSKEARMIAGKFRSGLLRWL